jgi:23S rRNA (guanosine2251-2'-O)-methyltransferase
VELLAGVHPVREALRAGRRTCRRVLVRVGAARRPPIAAVLALARSRHVPIEEVPAQPFDRLSPPGVRSQGVVLEADALPSISLKGILRDAPASPRWLVALDGIEDPQNLGAVARVAEAVGCAGLVLPGRRAAPLSAAAVRASAGALELLPVSIVVNLPRSLQELKRAGFWVLAADPDRGDDLFEAPDRLFAGDLVLVLGAEGRGLRPGVRAVVDAFVRVPLAGRVESLNVATAAAVILFEWRRRSPARVRS